MSRVAVRAMTAEDWPAVERIYSDGIATGHATFEPSPPASWEAFIESKHPELRLVAVVDGMIAGWAAASPVSGRAVYRGVVEHSVYVSPAAQGQRVGTALLAELIAVAEEVGIWTIQSSIFPENKGSLRLHQRLGFRQVGTRERIARMTYGPVAGEWRDTILVERRRVSD
ncbi:GNAT family N-acetyltransferase [Amnibacterium flavum]|uniref:N-acetyltransferase n=1 Tax=Amnibacterium flavum TaxID=2173173 RepID=A0A2V1HL48_9MICO|nr:GNAT family N-acetyltransferase [Amnibacterium flavum]PVZ93145.1 N-acetyltransferase [Amnibacterium flavum]